MHAVIKVEEDSGVGSIWAAPEIGEAICVAQKIVGKWNGNHSEIGRMILKVCKEAPISRLVFCFEASNGRKLAREVAGKCYLDMNPADLGRCVQKAEKSGRKSSLIMSCPLIKKTPRGCNLVCV